MELNDFEDFYKTLSDKQMLDYNRHYLLWYVDEYEPTPGDAALIWDDGNKAIVLGADISFNRDKPHKFYWLVSDKRKGLADQGYERFYLDEINKVMRDIWEEQVKEKQNG